MFKVIKRMLLAALLMLPWATQAQDCTQTVTQSQPYVQDFESVTGTTYSTAGQLPECWLGYTNGTTTGYKPHVVGSGTYWYTHSGTKALGFTSGSSTTYGNTKYVLMPPVNVALNQLELSFWMCTESSSSGTLYVGYVTSDDTSTFTSLNVYPASTATLHSGTGLQTTAGVTYTLNLSNVPANATRIAFKWYHNSTYYSCFIDDVVLGFAPTCPRVTNVNVVPSITSAIVSWSESGTASEWEVKVSAGNSVVSTQLAYEDSINITGLNPQTTYTVEVRAICDPGDTSWVTSTEFTTACAAVTSAQLPWTYEFDEGTTTGTTGAFGSTCLGRYREGTTTAFPYPSAAYHLSGAASAYFYGTAAIKSWMTLPLFDTPINGLYLTFYALKTSASYGHITIGVMSNPNDPTSFTAIESVQVQSISSESNPQWERFEVDLSSYQGNGQYITFMCSPSAANYVYIDNVTVSLPPTCFTSSDLTVDSVATDAVRLTWRNNSPTVSNYRVYYSTTPYFGIDTCLTFVTVTDTVAEIGNLPDNTDYYWTVVADCGGGDLSNVPTQSTFHTLRDCGDDLLNVIGTIGNGTSSGVTYFAYPSTSYPRGYTAIIYTAEELMDLGLQAGAYINKISIFTGATGGTINDLTLYLGETTISEFSGASDTTMVFHSFSPYWSGDLNCTANQWNSIELDSAFYFSGDNNLIVLVRREALSSAGVSSFYGSTSPYYRSLYGYKTSTGTSLTGSRAAQRVNMRFDMCAEQPSCLRPTTANVSADDQSITLTWNGCDNATSYLVEYGIVGSTSTTVEEVNVPSITISDLPIGTTYSIAIRTVCGYDTTNAYHTQATTLCHSITLADLPLTEDFESYGSGTSETISPCWNKGTTNTTAYPYPSNVTNAVVTGDRGLYFISNTSSYCWASLPPVDLDELQISDLELSFQLKRYSSTTSSYHSEVILGIMSTLGNFSTFDTIQVFDLTSLPANEVMSYNISLADYTGTGNRITFLAPQMTSGTNYIGLDNVMLSEAMGCPTPANLTQTGATADSVYISWEYSEYPDSWYVYIGTPGFNIDTVYPETVFDTIIGFGNLNANTEYEVVVVSSCSGLFSNATMPFTVRTGCGLLANDDFPFTENFESYPTGSSSTGSDFIPCWGHLNNGTSYGGYPYVGGSTYNHTTGGERGLYWYATTTTGTYGDYMLVALPGIDTNVLGINQLQLNFWAKTSSTSYVPIVQIGTMSDPEDITTFTLYETVDIDHSNTDWRNYEVMFDNYQGNDNYIAIKANRPSSAWYLYMDDIEMSFIPDCRRSSNLTVDSLSYDAALVSWSNSSLNIDEYRIYYSTQPNFNPDTCNSFETSNTTSVLLSGLQPYTTYYWTVVADCGDEDSQRPALQSFRTLMNCGTGYVNILDTIGQGTNSGYTYFAYNYNSYPYGYTASIFTSAEMGDMGLMAGANINSISVRAGSTACTINDLNVYMAETTLNGFTGASDTSLINQLNPTLVYNGSLTTTAGEWIDIPLTTPYNYSGTNNLLIIFERTSAPSASGTFYYGSMSPDYLTLYGYRSSATATRTATRNYNRVNLAFNLCAEVPSCVRPSDVTITSLEDTTVTINWVSNAGNYEYVLGTTGFDPDGTNVTTTTVTNNYVTINTLTPNTSYDFYVRTNCGSEVSDWSIVTSFTTACTAMPLPFTENFESYGTGTTVALNSCWTKGTNGATAYPYPYATNAISGNRSLYFYGYQPSSTSTTPIYSYAAMPMFAAPIDTLQVSFKMRRYSTVTDYYTSRLLVGVMTDPSDISTFVGIDTIDLKDEAALSVHQFEVNFDSYTGTGKYIAFYDAVPPTYAGNNYSYSYLYLDDIVVDYIPNCPRVTITLDSVSQNSASFHWVNRNGNNGFGYTIEYGPEGFSLGSGTQLTTIDTFITINGLAASEGYDFYVRPNCTATEAGPWSFPYNFRTVCGIYSLPYFEDFESYGSGSTYTIDPCWTKGTNNTTAYPYPYSTNAVSGERSLYFYSYHPSSSTSTAYYSYAAMPEFNANINTLELSFKVRRYGTVSDYYTTHLLVGVMSDPTDISTFVGVDTIDLKNEPASSIHEISVDFSGYTGTGNHIAIYNPVPPLYGSSTYGYSYAYVDDINVNIISPCGRPHNIQGVVSSNSITLSWTDTVNASMWQIEYGPTGFTLGTGTTVSTTVNPYTITSLTPSTAYDVYVRSYCPGGALGGTNNGIYTFITSQVPATVPYYYDFESASEWANWQTVSNNNVAWYRGTAEAAEGQYGLYVSTDGGQTCNSLHSTITNAAVYRDIDFGPTPGSFEVTFLAKSAGVSDGNYEGINVMLVDPAAPVNPSSTSLTSPWGSYNVVHVVRDTNWNEHTILFDNISGVHRLAFNWYTSTTSSHPVWDGAGAIDSLVVVPQSCVRPTNTSVTDIGADYVSLTWDGSPSANYRVRLQKTAGGAYIFHDVTTNSATITGLEASTNYYAWVFHVCDTDNVSWSSPRIEFLTTCTPYVAFDTLYEDFDSYTPTAYNAAGVLPDCWEAWGNGTTSNYLPHITNGSTYSYSVTGNPITMTSGSAAYGDTKILRLPKFAEPVNTLTLSYWYCTESSTYGVLSVGYMTGFDYENDFVPVVSHSASTASLHSGNGEQSTGHGIFDTVTFDSVPTNALFIAFKWTYNTSFYSVCIDNVQVTSTGQYCTQPTVTVGTPEYDNASIFWNGTATDYEVGIKLATDATFDDADNIAVTGNTYNFSGLTPNTTYQARVRAICDSTLISEWTVVPFTTAELPCFAPTELAATPGYDDATISWTAGGEETAWTIHVWNSSFNEEYNATTNPFTVTGLAQNISYYAAVKAICGNGAAESEYSDTISFSTLTCGVVSGVVANATSSTTATVTWNATGATRYVVNYGSRGFHTGEGNFITVTTDSATITGLEPESNYDVYVQAVCEEGASSNWSEVAQLTTPAEVGINTAEGTGLSIYPNPTTSATTIALSGVNGEVSITIVDMNGRVVMSDTMSCEGDCTKTMEVSGLAQGAYFVRISGENTNLVKKLVVK